MATAAELGPVAMIWLPRDGQVIAKVPAEKGNFRWLRCTVGIRSPRLANGRWHLPRNCLVRLVTATVGRNVYVTVWRDMSRLSRCTRSCLEAQGLDCDCSCLGVHHGEGSAGWFERVGDVMTADAGQFIRTAIVFGPVSDDTDAVVYSGELSGRLYRPDRASRRDWPRASRFMCAGCMTARAQAWDHCHSHGSVRAPLCNACNTRYWDGWHPQHGRVAASLNLDTSYYYWCPMFGDERHGPCSA